MQETQEMLVRSLDWENPPEKGMATHSSILNLGNPLDRGAWQTIVHVVAKSHTWMSTYAMPVIFFFFKKERKAPELGMISRSFRWSISFQFLVAGRRPRTCAAGSAVTLQVWILRALWDPKHLQWINNYDSGMYEPQVLLMLESLLDLPPKSPIHK